MQRLMLFVMPSEFESQELHACNHIVGHQRQYGKILFQVSSVCKDHPESVLLLTLEKPYRLSICLSMTSADDFNKIDILQACGILKLQWAEGVGRSAQRPV